ncbi:MAG: endosialidase [Anaerostipes sp.]|nr:endosialidase [Anaerostipes sp.]
MAVVTDLFQSEENGTVSFGDYTLETKAKKDGIEFEGDLYKIKTYKTMTKLDKNGQLIFESVPGSSVHGFVATTDGVAFDVESAEDVQITLEVEPEKEYIVYIDNTNVGTIKANLAGKLTIGVELNEGRPASVRVKKL